MSKELNVAKVYRCDCFEHGFGVHSWFDSGPRIKTGVNVESDPMFDGDYVDITIEFWFYGYGKGFYDTFKQRLKAAWLLLRGRRATFDAFSFTPGQIKELGIYLMDEGVRLNALGYDDDGMLKNK